MDRPETTLEKLEIFFGGATVFSALILLGVIVFSIRPEFLSPVVGLGVSVLLLALAVGAGVWYGRRWLRLGSWIVTVLLVSLGFLEIAIGPQVITVAGFALLTAITMTLRDWRGHRRTGQGAL